MSENMHALKSLIATGTKLWVDSVDPDEIAKYQPLGATGATSNPVIIADLINTGRFDDLIQQGIDQGQDDETIAWHTTDTLVKQAQQTFAETWSQTKGNDGYVSFELDPLLEAEDCPLSTEEKTAKYIELGKHWAQGHTNRMIKVPATPAGLAALEELAAAGVTLNVTLIFTMDQYTQARDAIWAGAKRRDNLDHFKSVYSVFISRIDAYTEKHVPSLSDAAQGQTGIWNAKVLYQANQAFWADKNCPLDQEMIFASTGTKLPKDPKDKYVEALAGDDIQTNPPSTNQAVADLGKTYTAKVNALPPAAVVDELAAKIDMAQLQTVLMQEGLAKFSDPQKKLLATIGDKRKQLTPGK